MAELAITCDSCERQWTVDHSFSVYEQEALESRPCPECGACTLSVARVPEKLRRRRTPDLVNQLKR